jgi:TRAP-type C4-dicarboxylate transport system substrate-binding protein
MKKTLFIIVLGLFGLMWVMVSGVQVQAQGVIEWRIHTPHGPGRSEYIMETEWADTLTKESGGRLKVTVYPNNALGFKDPDMYRVVPQKVIEGFMFYDGYAVRDDPILAMTAPEMILSERQTAVNYAPYAMEILKKRLSDKWKIRLSVAFASPQCFVGIAGKAPYNTLESMKGKKIRAWGQPQMDTFKKLGIPTQTMAQADLYLALKSGVLDGALWYANSYLLTSLYEVAPYWSTLYQSTVVLGMATSEAVFNALPPDLQEMMKRVENNLNKKWQSEAAGWCAQYDEPSFALLKAKGANILAPFSKEDQALLVKTGRIVWREQAKKLGPEAVKYQQALEAALIKAETTK